MLYVNAEQNLGPISPYVYGTNYGPNFFVPLQMQDAVKDARITFITFPDANWGRQNDLDEWQLDQFVHLCRQWGAEPRIIVRLFGGTAEKAAAVVKYVNLTKGYNVRYWGVGSEPNLYRDYELERYLDEWRTWAEAMRSVDPSIILLGPDVNQFEVRPNGATNQKAYDWLVAFLKANGDMVDVVSVHRYPFPKSQNGPPPKIPELRANSREWDEAIPALATLIRENTGRDLPIAVTEINSSWAASSGGEATLDSHFNAIWFGDVLGRLIRQNVSFVAQYNIIGDFGLMGRFEVYQIYYVYQMYKGFGTERVYASSDVADVSAYAARRDDGTLTLMLINLRSEAAEAPLTLDNASLTPPAETWLFDHAHNAEQVDSTALSETTTLNLPPESMTLLVISQR